MEINIDPDKSRRNARKIAQIYLKRELKPGECVHHINGDPRDNRIENLIVFSSNSAHQRFGHGCKLASHTVRNKFNKKRVRRKKARSHWSAYRRFAREFCAEEDIVLYGPHYKKARLARLERMKEQTKRDLGLIGGQDG
jgi:hypothetical protein